MKVVVRLAPPNTTNIDMPQLFYREREKNTVFIEAAGRGPKKDMNEVHEWKIIYKFMLNGLRAVDPDSLISPSGIQLIFVRHF